MKKKKRAKFELEGFRNKLLAENTQLSIDMHSILLEQEDTLGSSTTAMIRKTLRKSTKDGYKYVEIQSNSIIKLREKLEKMRKEWARRRQIFAQTMEDMLLMLEAKEEKDFIIKYCSDIDEEALSEFLDYSDFDINTYKIESYLKRKVNKIEFKPDSVIMHQAEGKAENGAVGEPEPVAEQPLIEENNSSEEELQEVECEEQEEFSEEDDEESDEELNEDEESEEKEESEAEKLKKLFSSANETKKA